MTSDAELSPDGNLAARDENDLTAPAQTEKKAARAFRTISEVSEELGIAAHVLRFWETKFEEVAPVKRGGQRRYYRPEDVLLLKKIDYLLHTENYTIKGVQKLLKDGTMNTVAPHISLAGRETAAAPAAESKNRKIDRMIDELEEMGDLLKHLLA